MENTLQSKEVNHEESSLNRGLTRSIDSSAEEDSSPNPSGIGPFSVPIHSLMSQCRYRHGLRHGNFEGYRRYCTRRLRRLRSSQDVKFMLSKGKQWIKGKMVEAADVMNSNHLLIPLLMAERAWAHAMCMKKISTKESWNARSRHHIQQRLCKAVKWAKQLEDLCSVTCDERTALEATAYASWMKGDRELDRECWEVAFTELTTASRIYNELATVGSLADQDIFLERAEEIRPRYNVIYIYIPLFDWRLLTLDTSTLHCSLRYCTFKVDREAPDARSLLTEKGAVNGVLAARLSSVVSKAQKEQTVSLDHVNWQGWKIPLRSEQLKSAVSLFNNSVSLLKEQSNEPPSGQSDPSALEDLYLAACNAHDDATTIIHDELADLTNQGMGSRAEIQRAELGSIGDFVLHSKLNLMIKWNEDLIENLLAEQKVSVRARIYHVITFHVLFMNGSISDYGLHVINVSDFLFRQEPVQPAVIVHIYDAILQNIRDLCKCLERVTADVDDSLTDDPLETLDRISYDEAL